MPDEPEAAGLLALMLLNESRVPARNAEGDLVLLRDQDRTTWDRTMIDEGHAIVRACIRRDQPGPFQLQAAIQAVHCEADSFEATDWDQIVALYDHLLSVMPTPVVALNRAIAIGESEGPAAALSCARRHRRRPRRLSPDARSPRRNVASAGTTRRGEGCLRTSSAPRGDGDETGGFWRNRSKSWPRTARSCSSRRTDRPDQQPEHVRADRVLRFDPSRSIRWHILNRILRRQRHGRARPAVETKQQQSANACG